MKHVNALIIGAGPAGLSLAYHLQGDTLILEKEDEVGGLCRSIEYGGGVFDIGGHSFHTPHPEVDALVRKLMGDDWFVQKRDARVFTHGVLIPYPFQKHFEQVPDPAVVEACRTGLAEAGNAATAEDFEEYIVRRFGHGIAEHFMLPYNRKLWARDLKGISCEWTSERVAAPKGATEHFDTRGGKRMPLQPDTFVGYPATGGYVEIYKRFVPYIPALELKQEVVAIDPIRRTATTATGEVFSWDRLVSTMPLPVLLHMIEGIPDDLVAAADRLEYMSLDLLLLLVGRRLPHAPQRIYVADPDVPPHKIAFNHHSSDDLRARPVHAIMAEISYSPNKPLAEADRLERDTIAFLVSLGILDSPRDVIWTHHLDVHYAYPVYTHDRPAILRRIKDELRRLGIFTLGRFGEWEYVNSDRCIKMGMDLAAELRRSTPVDDAVPVAARAASAQ